MRNRTIDDQVITTHLIKRTLYRYE